MTSPLIAAGELAALLGGGPVPVLLDVRYDTATGPRHDAYLAGHVPGAVFVDLDRDLASAPGNRGRHPLPDGDSFAAAMRSAGVDPDRTVVVYDDAGGLMAARAWWLLRHHGHGDVRLLDGGLAAWTAAGGAVQAGPGPTPSPGSFAGRPGAMPVIDAAGAARLARSGVLIDARAAARYRGEVEPLDPVAGHIPGARNRPTAENLGPDGRFGSPASLREAFDAVGVTPGASVAVYCGSGVTAAHEVLALEVAGVPGAALYPGSWSEWVADPGRPVATGDEPG